MGYASQINYSDVAFPFKYAHEMDKFGVANDEMAGILRFCQRLYNEGKITMKDTDGIAFVPRNKEGSLEMLKKYATREGFGARFADGIWKVSQEFYGKEAQKYYPQIKGMTSVDGRIGWQYALGTALSTRGADYLKGTPVMGHGPWVLEKDRRQWGKELYGNEEALNTRSPKGKPMVIFSTENLKAIIDSATFCKWATCTTHWYSLDGADIAELLSVSTGVDYSVDNLLEKGERIMLVERAFNARQGLRRNDDMPPDVWFDEPLVFPMFGGLKPLDKGAFEKALDEYYKLRGCGVETGVPTLKKLRSIDLGDVAKDLKKRGITED